jgi:hypothetical protein
VTEVSSPDRKIIEVSFTGGSGVTYEVQGAASPFAENDYDTNKPSTMTVTIPVGKFKETAVMSGDADAGYRFRVRANNGGVTGIWSNIEPTVYTPAYRLAGISSAVIKSKSSAEVTISNDNKNPANSLEVQYKVAGTLTWFSGLTLQGAGLSTYHVHLHTR